MSITSFISILVISILVIGHPTLGGETYVFAAVSLFVCLFVRLFVSHAKGGLKCPTECATNRGEGKEREYRLQTYKPFENNLRLRCFLKKIFCF